jgi:hypothetical protein
MTMPGFGAEASLLSERTSKTRSLRQRDYFAASSVQPQSLSNCLLNCYPSCEGDIIGNCRPWCDCMCRGKKKCPLPT